MDITDYINDKENIKLEDIGTYLRLMHMNSQPKTYDEMADMICDQFNVNCTAYDIEAYEQLHIQHEDMEKLERMAAHGYIEFNIE